MSRRLKIEFCAASVFEAAEKLTAGCVWRSPTSFSRNSVDEIRVQGFTDTYLRKANRVSCMVWIKRTAVVLSFILILGTIEWALSIDSRAQVHTAPRLDASSLQITTTLTLANHFQTTFEELGYGEKTLYSPCGDTSYSFRLPDYWLAERDSYLDLEFSYSYTEIESELNYASLGELSVSMDRRLLGTYSLNEPSLEHIHWQVGLPSELLNERPGASHQIELVLDAWFLCGTLHEGKLVVHPESILSLDYTLLPLTLDLANYPLPFYQRAFDSDVVRFVLPAQPSETELRTAAIVAAELGDLTGDRVIISATTDLDWLRMIESDQTSPEHLFVIGQPERNRLIPWLNDQTSLPVPLRRRELALSTQGPTAVRPGDVFSYTVTVTNTTAAPVISLTLSNQLPRQTSLINCSPLCDETDKNEVSWSLTSLSPGEAAFFSLELQLVNTAQLSPPAPLLENTVVLVDEASLPLNVSSLTTIVGPVPTDERRVASSRQSDYFFVQNGQPVPEGDGILQEIISPWDVQKVVMLITGVSGEAIYKAGQALGMETRFPEIEGPVALVREIRSFSPATTTLATDLTFADLGYTDQKMLGAYCVKRAIYYFPVPMNWRLTLDAHLRLLLTHSEALDEQASTLSILLNDVPLSTVSLVQENVAAGDLKISLPNANVRPGTANKLTVQILMKPSGDCVGIDSERAWMNISQNSVLHLDHQIEDVTRWDLSSFPFPFNAQADLGDVLFVLPPIPGLVEQEALLRMASFLGNAADGTGFSPSVSLGGALRAETLSRYHVIAIGRPSTNPLIQQINPSLPQPFVSSADEVEYQVGQVFLRLPPDTPLGYVQELESPWNEQRALVVVTGTADEGIAWATYALTRQGWRLKGNLALVRRGEEEVEVQSIDTRGMSSRELVSTLVTTMPELTPVATITLTSEIGTDRGGVAGPPTPLPSQTGVRGGLPTWVMLAVGATMMIVLIIFGVAAWRFRRR